MYRFICGNAPHGDTVPTDNGRGGVDRMVIGSIGGNVGFALARESASHMQDALHEAASAAGAGDAEMSDAYSRPMPASLKRPSPGASGGGGGASSSLAKTRRMADGGGKPIQCTKDFEHIVMLALSDTASILQGASGKIFSDVVDATVAFCVELANDAKCDDLKELKADAVLKKLGAARPKARNKVHLVGVLDSYEELLGHLEALVRHNQAAIRVERASKQNMKRKAEVASQLCLSIVVRTLKYLDETFTAPVLPIAVQVLF